MIYTVTMNPSLDYTITVDNFQDGKINRTKKEMIYPGGKGINVSFVLKEFGVDSIATGFVGGFTGKEIQRLVEEKNISTHFFQADGNSRINIKMESDKETQINGMGPSPMNLDGFIEYITNQNDSMVVLSGSLMRGMDKHIYGDICEALNGNVVVDTTGEALEYAITKHPFLIKPNDEELEALVGISIKSYEDAFKGASLLHKQGACNVIVSLGEKGAILLTDDGKKYIGIAPKGKVINTVGAGDSLVGGFLAEYTKNKNIVSSFQNGIVCGSATAFSDWLCTKEKVDELLNEVKVSEYGNE